MAEDHRPHATRGTDTCRIERERVTLATGVVTNDHAPTGSLRIRFQQVIGEPCRRLLDHQSIHPLRPRTDRGAQAGRAELQATVEPYAQFVRWTGKQTFQLFTHVGIWL